MNMPPLFDDPKLVRRMWRAVPEEEARDGLALLLRYQDPGGAKTDRAAGAAWLRDRLPGLTAERTLVAAGAQPSLVAVLGLLANHGDCICSEALAYPGLRSAAAHLGLTVIGLEMDDEGIVPAALAAACRDIGPKAVCCTPTLQNPTTATMSLRRRHEIIAVAQRYRLPIVEDDAYGRLPAAAEPPLAALAPDLTWHIAGLAKLASPALRIAYIAAPDERWSALAASNLRTITGMASPLTAAIATRWIRNGTAEAVLQAIRSETRARRGMAAEALGDAAGAAGRGLPSVAPAAAAVDPGRVPGGIAIPRHLCRPKRRLRHDRRAAGGGADRARGAIDESRSRPRTEHDRPGAAGSPRMDELRLAYGSLSGLSCQKSSLQSIGNGGGDDGYAKRDDRVQARSGAPVPELRPGAPVQRLSGGRSELRGLRP
jgi:aspartate/methionine/tyrosine aminotransferase